MGKQFAGRNAALSALFKGETGFDQEALEFSRLVQPAHGGDGLPVSFGQFGFGVEGVDLRNAARGVQENYPVRLSRKVPGPGGHRVSGFAPGLLRKNSCQRDRAHATGSIL